jgi:lysophospholipase L1-like esterase
MPKITRARFFSLGLCVVFGLNAGVGVGWTQTSRNTSQWEKEIAAFESQDRTSPPPKGAILFVGSSSFRKWTTLAQDFPGRPVINRGFGGSEIADSTALAERIIFPYEPRLIVFYAGDNDLSAGKTVPEVVADYAAFVNKVHARLPKTRIAFVSIKPSIARWHLRDKIVAANEQIKAMKGDGLDFIDVYPLMLGANGKPRPDLFILDGLHPSAKCYQLWAVAIKPHLE